MSESIWGHIWGCGLDLQLICSRFGVDLGLTWDLFGVVPESMPSRFLANPWSMRSRFRTDVGPDLGR